MRETTARRTPLSIYSRRQWTSKSTNNTLRAMVYVVFVVVAQSSPTNGWQVAARCSRQHHLKNPQMMDSVAPGLLPKIPTLWQPNIHCILHPSVATGYSQAPKILCAVDYSVCISDFLSISHSPPNIWLPLAKCKPIKSSTCNIVSSLVQWPLRIKYDIYSLLRNKTRISTHHKVYRSILLWLQLIIR